MIYYLSLTLGVFGAFILLGTLLGKVTYATGLVSMVWCFASALAVIWALSSLGVI